MAFYEDYPTDLPPIVLLGDEDLAQSSRAVSATEITSEAFQGRKSVV